MLLRCDRLNRRRVPCWLKGGYALFLAVLVPTYLVLLGPSNFLWFSDIALLGTGLALWFESRLVASVMAVAVLLPELVWNFDFFVRLVFTKHALGLTAYMFDPHTPWPVRVLSLFHVPLPWVVFWLVCTLGYDPRALLVQTLLAWIVLPLSYLLTPPSRNINWVHGLRDAHHVLFPQPFHLFALMVLLPLVVYLPTHLFLVWLLGRRSDRR